MKSNQPDQVNRSKAGDKKEGIQLKNTGLPNTDVLGMQEQEGETPATKIPGKSLLQKTESKTGKSNIKTGKL